MSRVGNKPIEVPAGVNVRVEGQTVVAEGPLGKLEREIRPEVTVTHDAGERTLVIGRRGEDRFSRAYHGLTRALLQNMVIGVSAGYQKKLEIVGVGYLAAIQGGVLQLRVGFANEIQKKIPAGLNVTCPDQTHVVIKGCDKQLVGQFAAEVRSIRKPEPYKGKGVRYDGEQIKLKPGKAAT